MLRAQRHEGRGPSLHLKRQGTHPVANAARLLCLEAGWLGEGGTAERLARLAAGEPTLGATAREAAVAYGVLADLRLGWQAEQSARGEPLSDRMPIALLGDTRRRLLLSAYETVEELRTSVRLRFGLGG